MDFGSACCGGNAGYCWRIHLNGHTAFSLQCHASLGLEESGINALLQQWITVLEAEIAQPLVYQIKAKPMAALRSDAERVQ